MVFSLDKNESPVSSHNSNHLERHSEYDSPPVFSSKTCTKPSWFTCVQQNLPSKHVVGIFSFSFFCHIHEHLVSIVVHLRPLRSTGFAGPDPMFLGSSNGFRRQLPPSETSRSRFVYLGKTWRRWPACLYCTAPPYCLYCVHVWRRAR